VAVEQEFARARAEVSLQPLGETVTYSMIAPVFLAGISSENSSLRIAILRLMVVMCEEEEKKSDTLLPNTSSSSSKSTSRGTAKSNPTKKRKSTVHPGDAAEVPVAINVTEESDAVPPSSSSSFAVTALQLVRLAGQFSEPSTNTFASKRMSHTSAVQWTSKRRR
jgi:hypothetical protein